MAPTGIPRRKPMREREQATKNMETTRNVHIRTHTRSTNGQNWREIKLKIEFFGAADDVRPARNADSEHPQSALTAVLASTEHQANQTGEPAKHAE